MPTKRVYRGLTNKRLPKQLTDEDAYNVRGGVEFGFLSCSTERSVAYKYSKLGSSGYLLFEMTMGMIDRGADLSWCSQYPAEREVLYAAAPPEHLLTPPPFPPPPR